MFFFLPIHAKLHQIPAGKKHLPKFGIVYIVL